MPEGSINLKKPSSTILTHTNPKRRTNLELIASILNACYNENKKYRVMAQCHMSFTQFARYLDLLLKANLLTVENEHPSLLLRISRKGEYFLKKYNRMKTMME